MRRRERPVEAQPPAHLLAYDPADWLPQVDDAAYDPEQHRNIHAGERVGGPHYMHACWRQSQALQLWSRARQEWLHEHGWPGGVTIVDLLREDVRVRRAVVTGLPQEGPW